MDARQEGKQPLTRRQLLQRTATGISAAALAARVQVAPKPSENPPESAEMESLLEPIRKTHDLPALAAAVVLQGQPAAAGAVGVRKYGSEVRVTVGDQFHLGSCTKAMTATLVGMLVEEGKLSWETPLSQALPDLAATIHPDRRNVTVEMLLAHRGGFPSRSTPEGRTLGDMHRLPGTPREQRQTYVQLFLQEPPDYPPGTKYVYANAGFATLGAITERLTDTPWETLITRRIFQPLGMASAGFGAMGAPGRTDQPWQHTLDGEKHRPIEPGPRSDNPDVIGPGGKVHCSMGDWAKFVAIHAREGRGEGILLKPETFQKLHTAPFGGNYMGGWLTPERGWGGGRVLTHAGSNTMNFAVTWVAPLKEFAVLIATNQAGGTTEKACDEVAGALIRRFLTREEK
jgi:CubicO group peptidase (beta-lactamase class C family)